MIHQTVLRAPIAPGIDAQLTVSHDSAHPVTRRALRRLVTLIEMQLDAWPDPDPETLVAAPIPPNQP